eukprot:Rmarinus@m.10236
MLLAYLRNTRDLSPSDEDFAEVPPKRPKLAAKPRGGKKKSHLKRKPKTNLRETPKKSKMSSPEVIILTDDEDGNIETSSMQAATGGPQKVEEDISALPSTTAAEDENWNCVVALLITLNLEKFAPFFRCAGYTSFESLRNARELDLERIGLTMVGPRRRLLTAIQKQCNSSPNCLKGAPTACRTSSTTVATENVTANSDMANFVSNTYSATTACMESIANTENSKMALGSSGLVRTGTSSSTASLTTSFGMLHTSSGCDPHSVEDPYPASIQSEENTRPIVIPKMFLPHEVPAKGKKVKENKSSEEKKKTGKMIQSVEGSTEKSSAPKTFSRGRRRFPAPFFKVIEKTRVIVDGFGYMDPEPAPDGSFPPYILTHFHSDHYTGLRASFKQGTIYCSPVTASLTESILGVPRNRIRALPWFEEVVIDGVRIRTLPANHCPGAAIFHFTLHDGTRILHTGDFRFTEEMCRYPGIRDGPLDVLYLDTTYCDPEYCFPPQEEVLEAVDEAVITELLRIAKASIATFSSPPFPSTPPKEVSSQLPRALPCCEIPDLRVVVPLGTTAAAEAGSPGMPKKLDTGTCNPTPSTHLTEDGAKETQTGGTGEFATSDKLEAEEEPRNIHGSGRKDEDSVEGHGDGTEHQTFDANRIVADIGGDSSNINRNMDMGSHFGVGGGNGCGEMLQPGTVARCGQNEYGSGNSESGDGGAKLSPCAKMSPSTRNELTCMTSADAVSATFETSCVSSADVKSPDTVKGGREENGFSEVGGVPSGGKLGGEQQEYSAKIPRDTIPVLKHVLFLVGTYSLGKERVFLRLASVLQRRVFVSESKYKVLSCCGYTEDEMRRTFTTDASSTNIHTTSLWALSRQKLVDLIKQHPRYSHVVAFKPTGWSYGGANYFARGIGVGGYKSAGASKSETKTTASAFYSSTLSVVSSVVEKVGFGSLVSATTQEHEAHTHSTHVPTAGIRAAKGCDLLTRREYLRGRVVVYDVPYSEHSSFTELCQCVKLLRPKKIIPTVNNKDRASSDRMIDLLLKNIEGTIRGCGDVDDDDDNLDSLLADFEY